MPIRVSRLPGINISINDPIWLHFFNTNKVCERSVKEKLYGCQKKQFKSLFMCLKALKASIIKFHKFIQG